MVTPVPSLADPVRASVPPFSVIAAESLTRLRLPDPLRSSVPPLFTVTLEVDPSAPVAAAFKVPPPAATVVAPLYMFDPLSVAVPLPVFETEAPAPEMTELLVSDEPVFTLELPLDARFRFRTPKPPDVFGP